MDAADLLLNWVALSGAMNEGEPAYDEETGVLIPGSNVWFDSVAIGTGIEQVTQTPKIGDDGRSITMVYDTPRLTGSSSSRASVSPRTWWRSTP